MSPNDKSTATEAEADGALIASLGFEPVDGEDVAAPEANGSSGNGSHTNGTGGDGKAAAEKTKAKADIEADGQDGASGDEKASGSTLVEESRSGSRKKKRRRRKRYADRRRENDGPNGSDDSDNDRDGNKSEESAAAASSKVSDSSDAPGAGADGSDDEIGDSSNGSQSAAGVASSVVAASVAAAGLKDELAAPHADESDEPAGAIESPADDPVDEAVAEDAAIEEAAAEEVDVEDVAVEDLAVENVPAEDAAPAAGDAADLGPAVKIVDSEPPTEAAGSDSGGSADDTKVFAGLGETLNETAEESGVDAVDGVEAEAGPNVGPGAKSFDSSRSEEESSTVGKHPAPAGAAPLDDILEDVRVDSPRPSTGVGFADPTNVLNPTNLVVPATTGEVPVVRVDTPYIDDRTPGLDFPQADQSGMVVPVQPEPVGEKPKGWTEFFGLPFDRDQQLQARKVRRVVRHIDPWSVLTFSVLFHMCFFAALLLASVLVWNVADSAGTIENIENFILELGDYKTFSIDGEAIFRAGVAIAGILTLASSVVVVLMTVVFNLLSDLIGGIRVTVLEEETVRLRPRKKTGENQ